MTDSDDENRRPLNMDRTPTPSEKLMAPQYLHPLRRYGLALAAVALATVIGQALDPILGTHHRSSTFLIAVLIAAWFAGLGPSVSALLLGLLASTLFFVPPAHSHRIAEATDAFGLAFYLIIGSAIIVICQACRAVESRLRWEVAERRRAEQSERAQREWLQAALASIGDALIVADVQGRVARLNRAAEELTGWPAEEAVGHTIREVFDTIGEETKRTAQVPLVEILDGSIRRSSDYTLLRHRGGESRPVEHTTTPIKDEAGRITGVVLVFRDVTERWRAEQALKDADRRKDEFLAVLAHELRNPLAPIATALQIMRLEGDVRDFAIERAMAERQLRHLSRLIDDLMDVSRISQGKIRLHPQVVDLDEIVARVAEACRPLIDQRNQTLMVQMSPEPMRLLVDPTRLEQVLSNLLCNSVKYTDPGGQIWLTAERSGAQVAVRVRDTGIGIEPDVLPRVFEMFVQGERRMDRAQGGLGIGLSLVKSLVELHGGAISAHSEGRGKGSTFEVRLPCSSPAVAGLHASTLDPQSEPDGGLPRWRILVVDDNVDAADGLQRLLVRRWDQEVRVAYDGPSALEVARLYGPEVVLLDIGLPGMDGYEVARRLRERPETADALLVAVTGWDQEGDRRRSRQSGFDRHLAKPVDAAKIEDLLRPAVLVPL
jgi:PAS domain S-box-containing protein